MVYKLKLHTSVCWRYAIWATHLNFFTCINNIITCQAEILPGRYLQRLFHDSCHNHGEPGGSSFTRTYWEEKKMHIWLTFSWTQWTLTHWGRLGSF